jgi:RNA polymerase sigma-70 factor (ECF subfamily)
VAQLASHHPAIPEAALIAMARGGDHDAFRRLAEPYARELHVHCYRMLGSLHDAEDLVQETLLRAWRRLDSFTGQAPFRAWLYKIATNACLDALARRSRRIVPSGYGPAADPREPLAAPVTEPIWLEPYPDTLLDQVYDASSEPEPRYVRRESIELAFLAAIQYLPPRQRAVLILRDALDWAAIEVADLLDATVASVNSALQRARSTLKKRLPAGTLDSASLAASDEVERSLLSRYITAWEAADIQGLVALLKEDATFAMPPIPSWFVGREAIAALLTGTIFAACGASRLVPTRANRQPALAVYHWDAASGQYRPFAISLLTLDGDAIAGITAFVDAGLFRHFGLPVALEGESALPAGLRA